MNTSPNSQNVRPNISQRFKSVPNEFEKSSFENIKNNFKNENKKSIPEIKISSNDENEFDELNNGLIVTPNETTSLNKEKESSLNDTFNSNQIYLNPPGNVISDERNNLFLPLRSRNDSFKQFTARFRTFSNDFIRSIELAHDMADIRNSKFSAATQTAAVQLYKSNKTDDATKCNEQELNIILDESSKTSNGSIYQKSNIDETERRISMSSSEKFPGVQNRLSPKIDSSFDKALTNLNKNSFKTKLYSERLLDSSLDKIDENDVQHDNIEAIKLPNNKDERDYKVRISANKEIPDDIHISVWEVFIYLWGVITFFADLISDIILSIEYFNGSKFWLGFMTLMLVLVPNITLSLFSLSWYIDKYYSTGNKDDTKKTPDQQPKSTCDSIIYWITTILFVVFQIDLIWKYIQGFIYTVKGWAMRYVYKNLVWEKYYIEKQIKCDTDIGMLRLIDVFMDSGPQVLLQLYVITTQNLNDTGSANLIVFTLRDFKTTSLEFKQFFSIFSSLLSMGYALAGYQRCLRNQQFIFCLETNKPLRRPMSWFSTIMQFLWYLFLIAPRVLAMAIFASTFRSWFFMIIFTHWLIMYSWILRLKTNYCITSESRYNAREEIFEKFYDFVCSFIYIFVYFNLKSGSTRYRYLIYYIIFYSENLIFSISYFLFSKETNLIYKLSMLLVVIIGFWIAITFQIVYYLYCHPSQDFRICVKDSKSCITISEKTINKKNTLSNCSSNLSVYQLNSNKVADNDTVKTNDLNLFNLSNKKTEVLINYNLENKSIEKSKLSLNSLSSENSMSSSLNLSQSNLNQNHFKYNANKKNSLSKSGSSISLPESNSKFYDPTNKKLKRLKSNEKLYKSNRLSFEYSFFPTNGDNAPLASIKELLMLDEELSKVIKSSRNSK
jgi:hypothetical protein